MRDLAAGCSLGNGNGKENLTIIASSLEHLSQKLQRADERFFDRERGHLQTRSGIFFRQAPLECDLAFMFP